MSGESLWIRDRWPCRDQFKQWVSPLQCEMIWDGKNWRYVFVEPLQRVAKRNVKIKKQSRTKTKTRNKRRSRRSLLLIHSIESESYGSALVVRFLFLLIPFDIDIYHDIYWPYFKAICNCNPCMKKQNREPIGASLATIKKQIVGKVMILQSS